MGKELRRNSEEEREGNNNQDLLCEAGEGETVFSKNKKNHTECGSSASSHTNSESYSGENGLWKAEERPHVPTYQLAFRLRK